jgi:phage terminase small subunit
MDRNELIEKLESDAITTDDAFTSTNVETPDPSEAMRIAVAKVQEKKTKKGKVFGVKLIENEKEKRLTPKQRLFVTHIMSGMTKIQAYRASYDCKTDNDATITASANKLIHDPRVLVLLQGYEDTVREKVIEDAVRTRRFVMEKLHDRVNSAKTESAELKALELMGRAVGMFTDKVEGKVEQISTEKLKEELKSHLTLLENVTPITKRSA